MAMIRLTRLHEQVDGDGSSLESEEVLINSQTIEWVTTTQLGERIVLKIKRVGETQTSLYAVISAIGYNTSEKVDEDEALRNFQQVVRSEEGIA